MKQIRTRTAVSLAWSVAMCFTAIQPSHAEQDSNCFPYRRYESEFLSKFNVIYADDQKYIHCDLDNAPYVAAKAYFFLKDLPHPYGSHPRSPELIRERLSDYFDKSTQVIRFINNDACKTMIASHSGLTGYSKSRMTVCPRFARLESLAYQASVLLHEARHGDDFDHVGCDHGILSVIDIHGRSCDSSFELGGSYAVQAEFGMKLSRSEASNSVQKQDARSLAIETLLIRFEKQPFGLRYGAIIQRLNGSLVFDDFFSQEVLLAGRANNFIVYSHHLNRLVDRIQYIEPIEQRERVYHAGDLQNPSLSRKAVDPRIANRSPFQMMELKDIIFTENYSCYLWPNNLECRTIEGESAQVNLGFTATSGAYNSIQYLKKYGSDLMPTGVSMIRSSSGTYYQLPESFESLRNYGARSLTPVENRYDLLSTYRHAADGALALKGDGSLLLFLGDMKGPPIPYLPNQKFKKLIAPVNWSKKLEDI